MKALDRLKPQSVFHFFEEICQIPHGSGNTRAISDYLRRFAGERDYPCMQDALGNIVIIREASPGREGEEPYMLQAHMDMVAVAAPGSGIDMAREPLRLAVEGGEIFAEGTSLGGDDGIGVAYCLALLDDRALSLPRLEVVLTVDEETGMEGAWGIDLSMLQGRRMLNLDQEEEGVFITSCAGGARVDVEFPLTLEGAAPMDVSLFELRILGLTGGHSGMEIHKGSGNAVRLLGEALFALSERHGIRLLRMEGGHADNAIPREASAQFLASGEAAGEILAFLEAEEGRLRDTLRETDPGFVMGKLCHNDRVFEKAATKTSTRQALACLCALPNGVISMSRDVPGLVETSLNLGVLSLGMAGEEARLQLRYAVRSSLDESRDALCERMREIGSRFGAAATVRNAYPGWAYRKDSPLRERMARLYERMYGKPPVLQAIHAGLECGILMGKLPGLDCVSIGPNLFDVHTAGERMDISSVGRVWDYLLALLTEEE